MRELVIRSTQSMNSPEVLKIHTSHLKESDSSYELVDVTGANVPDPEEPLGGLPDALHVEQVPVRIKVKKKVYRIFSVILSIFGTFQGLVH